MIVYKSKYRVNIFDNFFNIKYHVNSIHSAIAECSLFARLS